MDDGMVSSYDADSGTVNIAAGQKRMKQILARELTALPQLRVCLAVLALLCLIFGVCRAVGQETSRTLTSRSDFGAGFLIADMDGDERPDLATVSVAKSDVLSTDYFIQFRFTSAANSTIGVTARGGGLDFAQRDVNGDSILDLVVSTAFDSKVVAILVNDGHGKYSLKDPASFPEVSAFPDTFLRVRTEQTPDLMAIAPTRSELGHCQHRRSIPDSLKTAASLILCGEMSTSGPCPLCSAGRAPPSIPVHTA